MSNYDENGNLQIPAEALVQNLSGKLANKELENSQLQLAVEILSKELQELKSDDGKSVTEVVKK